VWKTYLFIYYQAYCKHFDEFPNIFVTTKLNIISDSDTVMHFLVDISIDYKQRHFSYLSVAFEDIALEDIGGTIPGDVREDFEIGAVVGDVEDAVYGVVHDLNAVAIGAATATSAEQLRTRTPL
jgi:hypothetical protein